MAANIRLVCFDKYVTPLKQAWMAPQDRVSRWIHQASGCFMSAGKHSQEVCFDSALTDTQANLLNSLPPLELTATFRSIWKLFGKCANKVWKRPLLSLIMYLISKWLNSVCQSSANIPPSAALIESLWKTVSYFTFLSFSLIVHRMKITTNRAIF